MGHLILSFGNYFLKVEIGMEPCKSGVDPCLSKGRSQVQSLTWKSNTKQKQLSLTLCVQFSLRLGFCTVGGPLHNYHLYHVLTGTDWALGSRTDWPFSINALGDCAMKKKTWEPALFRQLYPTVGVCSRLSHGTGTSEQWCPRWFALDCEDLEEYLEITWGSKNAMLHFFLGILFPE